MFSRSLRPHAVCVAVAGALILGTAPAQADTASANPWSLTVKDHIGLPGEPTPIDTATVVYNGPDKQNAAQVKVEVYRGGTLIAPASPASEARVDLQVGDEIRMVEVGPNPRTMVTYTYAALPGADRTCAGTTTITGSRTSGSEPGSLHGAAVLWSPATADAPAAVSDQYLPGYAPGFRAEKWSWLTPGPEQAGRFTGTVAAPLVAGMHVYVNDAFRASSEAFVIVETDRLVEACPAAPTPAPVADKLAPKGAATGPSAKALQKMGPKALLRGGVPLAVTVNEVAQLKGTISLLGAKAPVRANVALSVKTGKSSLKVIVPNALRRAVRKVSPKKTPKLQLKLALVDPAGNSQRLKTITIKLPKG